MNSTERQTWIAALAVTVTVIGTVIGTAWWTGRQMVTREDLAELRQEMAADRQEMNAAHALIREEIASQMREIRGYIIDHLEDHPTD